MSLFSYLSAQEYSDFFTAGTEVREHLVNSLLVNDAHTFA